MPCSTLRAASCSPRATTAPPLFSFEESGRGDWVERLRSTGSVLFGVSVARPVGQRMYWIQVGQDLSHRDVIIDDVVTSFFPRVGWITFPILLVLLLIDILIFRRALEPVREASTTAAAIGPARTDVRLPEQAMPAEIVPLVHAVNQAFDRLEAGFRAQRDFTADMAHELRTPLAIMRARVDALEPGPVRDALRTDLVNMTRTVSQVLDIAELESFVIAGDARADLHAVCAEAVGFMAPLAVDMSKTIALTGVDGPVWVRGHAEALFRAVRNLVDNAIRHTPSGGVDRGRRVGRRHRARRSMTAPACPRPSVNRSSGASGGAIARRPKAAGWAWRSWPGSRRPTTAASRSRTARAAAPSSRCACGQWLA